MRDWPPPYDQLLVTAERVARERPDEVDPDLAREVFEEAATLLHDGLVLDHLDEHDAAAVVAGLCEDLVRPDPGAVIRARADALRADPAGLHEPEVAAATYLTVVALFRL
ncbi:hypothetical protein G5V58_03200 [Nocardioides anomalus]|uniref:Uncharacterized protein n=1 Tax=Nocardioides anomalus TaxID=2712223 RepID=A0A6G6W9N7_9ACTN|nr:hypothetical protein [Nocardioides anomalus]QIG41919.1 hypothetical protein G5V58_03200 [Nocardioides anomalus]